MPESAMEPSRAILDTQNIKISGDLDRENFEHGSQILTYPHFCTFEAVTLAECTAHFKIILASTRKQISCITFNEIRQKLWGNSWNYFWISFDFSLLCISDTRSLAFPFLVSRN